MSDAEAGWFEPFDTIWPEQAPAATGTPRTDAAIAGGSNPILPTCVGADFARALETDLAAANAQLQQVIAERDRYRALAEAQAAQIKAVLDEHETEAASLEAERSDYAKTGQIAERKEVSVILMTEHRIVRQLKEVLAARAQEPTT